MLGFFTATLAVIYLLYARKKARAFLAWPQAKATVDPANIRFQKAQSDESYYIPEVSFKYKVGERFLSGNKLLPVGWTVHETQLQKMRLELELHAQALYNPNRPEEAFLDLPDRCRHGSISWVTVGLLVSCILSIILGITLLISV